MEDLTAGRFEATVERLDAENTRQNHRLADIESQIKELRDLNVAVGKMAVSLETMAAELKKQGERLEKMEQAPSRILSLILTAIISTVVAASVTFLIR